MTKTKIAVCIPMTSKKQNWMKLGDSFFITIFLPSFLRTYEDIYMIIHFTLV